MDADSIVIFIKWLHSGFPAVGTLILLMLFDVVFGLMAAFVTKTMSSTISYVGMMRKVGMLMLIAVCVALDPYAGDVPVSKLAAVLFIYTELLSIVENAARAGIPIPPALTDVLQRIKPGGKAAVVPPTTSTNVTIDKASHVDIHSSQDSGVNITK